MRPISLFIALPIAALLLVSNRADAQVTVHYCDAGAACEHVTNVYTPGSAAILAIANVTDGEGIQVQAEGTNGEGIDITAASVGLYAYTQNSGGNGVLAYSSAGAGVTGSDSTSGQGVVGISNTGVGVYGRTESGVSTATGPYGVYGSNSTGDAIHGEYNGSGGSSAVAGIADTAGFGVYGTTASTSSSDVGVEGLNSGSGVGVVGIAGGASVGNAEKGEYGVVGLSAGGEGVRGFTSAQDHSGVWGETTASADGVNDVGVYGKVGTAGAGVAIWGENNSTAASAWAGYFNGQVEVTSGNSYYYNGTATCVGGHCASDRRLKQNIEPLSGALERLLKLKGVTFEWKADDKHARPKGTQTGFVAQDVEKAFPGWVDDDIEGFKGVVLPPMELAALEVEAFRTMKVQLDEVKAENAELKDLVHKLGRGEIPAGSTPMGPVQFNFNGAGWLVAGALGATLWGMRKRDKVQA